MKLNQLTAISPIDGRYFEKTKVINSIFSEFGLIKYRVLVEIKWFLVLAKNNISSKIPQLSKENLLFLENIIANFSIKDAKIIKDIENTTNHDVKAVEYFLKDKFRNNDDLKSGLEFIHFACTSEDINNLSYALALKDGREIILNKMQKLIELMAMMAKDNAKLAMISRTHGQKASPTTIGKEIANFVSRLKTQAKKLEEIKIMGKFNGAVGNFNAHKTTCPKVDWRLISNNFINSFGVNYAKYTTQIEPHDYIAEYFHAISRFNNILIDFCCDVWGYISLGYFKQKLTKNEVGSSTMPHKINPIDFENAEGNLGLANSINTYMADKLVISRWQRDLSDSTVLRNLGVSLAHSLIAYDSIIKGVNKLKVDSEALAKDLDNSWEILAEPIQTIMRLYGIENPYEKLKELTRGQAINRESLQDFIKNLDIPDKAKKELLALKPSNYIGYADELAQDI